VRTFDDFLNAMEKEVAARGDRKLDDAMFDKTGWSGKEIDGLCAALCLSTFPDFPRDITREKVMKLVSWAFTAGAMLTSAHNKEMGII